MAEPDQNVKPPPAPLFSAVVSPLEVGQEIRRMAGLCLADLRPIAGFARASDERKGGGCQRDVAVSVY